MTEWLCEPLKLCTTVEENNSNPVLILNQNFFEFLHKRNFTKTQTLHQVLKRNYIKMFINILFLLILIPCVYLCVLCSWNQTQLSTFGKETSSNTRMRWQKLHHQGTRPCCPLPGTWTVSPTARIGRAITKPTHRILRVCLNLCRPSLFFFPCISCNDR